MGFITIDLSARRVARWFEYASDIVNEWLQQYRFASCYFRMCKGKRGDR